jgi:hypothetical protein
MPAFCSASDLSIAVSDMTRRPGIDNWHLNPKSAEEKFGFTEHTLLKAIDAVRERAGLSETQSRQVIDALYNSGLVIREKVVEKAPTGPVYRGVQDEAVPISNAFQNYIKGQPDEKKEGLRRG